MSKPTKTLFFDDKPLFGLDIGRSSLRVMQLETGQSKPKIIGYGSTDFDGDAIVDGVITKPEIVAKNIQDLFRHNIIGDITTNRVALSVPISHAFTRSMNVPGLSDDDIDEAVRTEVEQYIPAPIDDLYFSYSRTKNSKSKDELFLVAMPKKVVDSYLTLTRLIGLEAILVETTIGAGANLFARDKRSDLATLLVDFGTESADITVYKDGLIVSGTVASGGDKVTQLIMDALGVTSREATIIKSKYGLGHSKKQAQIKACLTPLLNLLTKEIKRTVRYYEERSTDKNSIEQVLIMGGGANMPGLAEYLTDDLRLPVRAFDSTSQLDFKHLQPLSDSQRMSYVTVAGLALTNPTEVFI
jgi:type IV pilus assembly protein PilM